MGRRNLDYTQILGRAFEQSSDHVRDFFRALEAGEAQVRQQPSDVEQQFRDTIGELGLGRKDVNDVVTYVKGEINRPDGGADQLATRIGFAL